MLAARHAPGRRPGAVLRRALQGAREKYGERSAADFGVPFPSVHDDGRRPDGRGAAGDRPAADAVRDRPTARSPAGTSARSQSQAELDALVADATSGCGCDATHRTPTAGSTTCPTGCGRSRDAALRRPARAAQPVPAAGRGRPRVGGADPVRRVDGPGWDGADVLLIERAARHAQPRRPGRLPRRRGRPGRRRTGRGGAARGGGGDRARPRGRRRRRRRCPRCSCRRAASSSRRCSAGGATPSPVSVVDPREVASVHRVPLAELLDPANRLPGHATPAATSAPAFDVAGLLVWGFTAGPARPVAAPGRLGAAVGPQPTCDELPPEH